MLVVDPAVDHQLIEDAVGLDRLHPVEADPLFLAVDLEFFHRILRAHADDHERDRRGEQLAAWAREVEAPAPAPDASGSAASTAAPSRPDDERRALLAEIKRLADAAKLTSKERVDAWRTYCGDAKSDAVDVAALADLLAWVTTRTRA